jgi:hypothetical protein
MWEAASECGGSIGFLECPKYCRRNTWDFVLGEKMYDGALVCVSKPTEERSVVVHDISLDICNALCKFIGRFMLG